MGMFDEVVANCPICLAKDTLLFQSKAGKCDLSSYRLHEVPPIIAASLDGNTDNCKKCGRYIKIQLPSIVRTAITMELYHVSVVEEGKQK